MQVAPPSDSLARTVILAGTIGASEVVTFSPTGDRTLQIITYLFESVVISGLRIDVFLPTGKMWLATAATTSTTPPADFHFVPVYQEFGGSDLGPTSHAWEFEYGSFGRQIKTTPVGNLPPQFHFKLNGASTSATAKVRIALHLQLAGAGILPAISFTDMKLPVARSSGQAAVGSVAETLMTVK
jgi:hypothetical protein